MECPRPDHLFAVNALAWRAWDLCDQAGREGFSGGLRIESVITTLGALDGCEGDLDKVLAIEAIAKKHRKIEEAKKEE